MDQYVRQSPPRAGTLTIGERSAYIGGGLMLAAASLRPRPNFFLTLLAFGTGAYLAWRGVEGRDPVKAMIIDTPRQA